MKYLITLLALLLFASPALPQVNPANYYDSGWVMERKIDTLALQNHAQDKDFQYRRELIEQPNLLEKFTAWILEKLFRNYTPGDVTMVYNSFLVILILVAAVILIYYLSRISRSRLITSKGQAIPQVQFLDFEGSSHELDRQWQEAEKDKNYALALRFLFIKTLHFLKEANSIEWKKEKTNSDYLHELKERWQQGPFSKLSELFAYTQYGGYTISEEDYQAAKDLYELLLKGGKGDPSNG